MFEKIHASRVFIIALVCILMTSVSFVNAQLSITSVEANLRDTLSNNSICISRIEISDTSNCSLISIQLSEGINDSILFSNDFVYDELAGLPNGVSYSRIGNMISINLGVFSKYPLWNIRLRIRDNQSIWTAWEEFSFN